MRVLRASKMPWLRIRERLARGLGRLIKSGHAGLGGDRHALAVSGLFYRVACKYPGVSGFNFEVSMTDCWHNPDTGVFVSRLGQSGKTHRRSLRRLTQDLMVGRIGWRYPE
jgi:hypothetical protein